MLCSGFVFLLQCSSTFQKSLKKKCTTIQSREAIELKQLYGLIVTTNSLTRSPVRNDIFQKTKRKKRSKNQLHTRVSTEGLNETHALTSNAHHWLLALYAHNGIESVSVILVKTFHRLEDWFRAFVRRARDRRFTWRRTHAISFTFIRFVRIWRFGVIVSVSVTLRTHVSSVDRCGCFFFAAWSIEANASLKRWH